MSLTNVLNDFPYRPRFYITKPWKFLQECWWNIKAAWQRATKGHAWRDSVEMDEFLLHIIPSMLRDIANGDAYPDTEPFETAEKWEDWCNSLADVFESVQEENWMGQNEWKEEWRKIPLRGSLTKEQNEIRELYYAREKELWERREQIIQDAYAQLAKYHGHLWI